MMSSYVDTNLLRNAVRMVHCIQKERGSSCGYYSDNKGFERAMMEAREKTDIAAGLIQHKDLPIARSINKIRTFIEKEKDKNRDNKSSSDNTVLHRIFVCFNTLISSVIYECILQPVGRQDKTTVKNRHKRGLSWDINDRLSSELVITPDQVTHKTEPGPITAKQLAPRLQKIESMDSYDGDVDSIAPPPPPQQGPPPLPPSAALESALRASSWRGKPSTSSSNAASAASPSRKVNFDASTKSRVHALLDVLHTFVQLKESAGIERAILSSILAHKTEDASFRMLTNDLILQVENQRGLVAQLEGLPSGQYRSIALDLAELSPRLKELHNLILTDFDSIQNDDYDSGTLWEVITLYIDKLHSVELLIIEELECSQPLPMKRVTSAHLLPPLAPGIGKSAELSLQSPESQQQKQNLAAATVLREVFHSTDERSLVSLLESTSGEDIKKRLLAVLDGKDELSDSSASDHAHQYGAAASLNEGLNNALNDTMDADEPASKEWEVSIYEIKFTRRIGQGASATTYLANWTGQEVAVKVASTTTFGLEGWRTEVAALQRLHHPNIIRLLGSIYHKNPLTYCLVLEYCNAGDLNTALKYPTPRNFFFHVAISIANAMAYLHSRNVIHRDLKPQNVLCHGNVASGNFAVKVTDFGVATEALKNGSINNGSVMSGGSPRELTGETGTYRWMAPEVVRHETYSTKADVYSFAIMVWQFLTHEDPFHEDDSTEAARLAAIEKARPPIPQGTPKAVRELIEANWSDKPDDRSKFDAITASLQTIKSTVNATEKAFLEEPYGHPVYVYEEPELESENNDGDKKKVTKEKRGSLLSHFFGNHKKAGKR